MRIFLIILLVLLFLLILILCSQVEAAVEYWDGKFRYAVRYFGIQVYPFRKKPEAAPDAAQEEKKAEKEAKKAEKQAKKKAKADAKKQAEQEAASQEKKKQLLAEKMQRTMQKIAETCDMAGDALFAAPAPLKKLFSAITLTLETDFCIGGEDAADTAILYGRVQLALQNALANLGRAIHVKRKKVRIACDFVADESRWNVRASVKVRIGTALAAALWLLWNYWWGGRKARKSVVNERI